MWFGGGMMCGGCSGWPQMFMPKRWHLIWTPKIEKSQPYGEKKERVEKIAAAIV